MDRVGYFKAKRYTHLHISDQLPALEKETEKTDGDSSLALRCYLMSAAKYGLYNKYHLK